MTPGLAWLRPCSLVLVLLAGAMPAGADVDGSARADEGPIFPFGAWIELSAEGRVVDATLPPDPRLPAALHDSLLQGIEARVFEPARGVDGIAKPSRSWLQGHLRLVPQADNYEIIVEPEQLGPRLLQPFRPRTGRPPDRPVRLLLSFDVTAEGRASNVEVTAIDRAPSGLASRIADSVRALRFEPEQVDGQPVATRLRWPFQVLRSTSGELSFDLPPLARDPQRPGVPGQDAYALPTIFTLEFRGAVSITL